MLQWALDNNRILLTHDVNTIPMHATELWNNNQQILGIILVTSTVPIGDVINDIIFINENSEHEEWVGQLFYLPL